MFSLQINFWPLSVLLLLVLVVGVVGVEGMSPWGGCWKNYPTHE